MDVRQHLTRLEQQRRVENDEIMAGHAQTQDLLVHLAVDLRMRHRIQEFPLFQVAEDQFAEQLSINRFVVVEDFVAELGANLLPSRLARFDDYKQTFLLKNTQDAPANNLLFTFSGDDIRIDHRNTFAAQHTRHRTLAGGDASGQPHDEHVAGKLEVVVGRTGEASGGPAARDEQRLGWTEKITTPPCE